MKISSPNRVTHTYRQRLVAPVTVVFPLLCPVRERDWIVGWDPIEVISESGLAEPGCVFITAGEPQNAVWVVLRHEPSNGYVEMLKLVPSLTACRLSIQLCATAEGCDADISYSHTSLSPAGDAFLASFTRSYFEAFMQAWEARLNHYLKTGQALELEE
jgi:hypothetical protein